MKNRSASVLLVMLLLFSDVVTGQYSERKTAILADGFAWEKCNGLDCPPWPVPPDGGFCFRAGDSFYTGESRESGLPWATKAKRLLALQGQSMEIIVTEKRIIVMAPRLRLTLDRTHDDGRFKVTACKNA